MNIQKKKVLVTGASGYLGCELVESLMRAGAIVTAVSRAGTNFSDVENIQVNSYANHEKLKEALLNIDIVFHLAARAHQTGEIESSETLQKYMDANFKVSVELFKLAQSENVIKFIYLSSIGVNGNKTEQRAFTESDIPNPIEQYAKSKWKAEQDLTEISRANPLLTKLTIVRPPLVYGPNAPGNFGTLIKLAAKKLPLPIGAIKNDKSFIYIKNLTDFLINYSIKPAAENEIFVVADESHFSTPGLYQELATRFNAPINTLYIPNFILQILTSLLGRKKQLAKLNNSLVVDASKAKKLLNWKPLISPEQALDDTVYKYNELKNT